MAKQQNGTLYTLSEAALMLKCSTRTIRRRIGSGELTARRHRRRLLVSAGELARFIDSMPETNKGDL